MNKKLLVITPAMTGGSWRSVSRLVDLLPSDIDRTILTLGRQRKSTFRVVGFPYPSYEKLAPFVEPNFISTILYFLPWYFVIVSFVFAKRPKVVLVNGLSSVAPLLITKRLMNERIVLSFHSYLNSPFAGLSRLVRGLLSEVNLATANSTGSRDNLSLVMPEEKIRVVEHVPDRLFFNELNRKAIREKYRVEKKLVILYVGRLDADKRCDRLVRVCDCLHDSDDVLFVFVGEGVLSELIEQLQKKRSNILYLGYVNDRDKMHELYTLADLTWSFADETYLALPALESLASGTPILIPELAAVRFKDEAGVKVNPNLVPTSVGWIIPDTDAVALAQWLHNLDKDKLHEKRAMCKAYATKRYLDAGLSPEVVDDLARLFM